MGRIFGRFVGNALLTLGFFLVGGAVFFYWRAHVEFKPKTTLIAQIQFELDETTQMKNVVSLAPRGGEDDPIDVKVEYGANPPAVQRAMLVKDTNIVVRRHIPNIGDVNVVFPDMKVPGALTATDGGALTAPVATGPTVVADPNAVPGANGPPPPPPSNGPKPTVTVTPDRPKVTGSGTVTIVTFPESYVEEGTRKLGKTPLFDLKLPAGTHLLLLTGADGAVHRLSVPVVANQKRVFKMKLDEVPTK